MKSIFLPIEAEFTLVAVYHVFKALLVIVLSDFFPGG